MSNSTRQSHLFVQQANLLDLLPAARVVQPNPDNQRKRLLGYLETARAAAHMPWDEQRESVITTLFRQMSGGLPADECKVLRSAFADELERLHAAGPYRPTALCS